MAATFTTTGEWQGTLRGSFQTANKVAGKPVPSDGYLWRRKIYTVERFRWGKGLLTYNPNVGGTALGGGLCITSGTTTVCGNDADTYMLQKDDVSPSPPGSDIWKEVQIAVSYSLWEEWLVPTTTTTAA